MTENNNLKYQIRDMKSSDWEVVGRIYQEGMDTNIATFQTDCPTWEEFDASRTKDCRFVILDDEEIIGWATLASVSKRPVYRGVAEVSVYIDAGYQGKGVGYELLKHLAQKSEEAGYWTLQSGIMPENLASVKLHEKCGFRMVGYREKIGKDRFGVWRDNFLMERRSKFFR